MDQIVLLLKNFGPSTLLIALIIYCVRAVYTGDWIPRRTHEDIVKGLREDRDLWKASSEKWEGVSEDRLKMIQSQQASVLEVTAHIVRGIREVGPGD